MPVVAALNSDLSQKHEILPQGTTYNIMVFGGDKAALPTQIPAKEIIEAKVE
jgi:hypothetical protein